MPGFQLAVNQTAAEYPAPLYSFLYATNTAPLTIGDAVHAETNDVVGTKLKQAIRVTSASANQPTIGVVMGMDIDPDNEVVGIKASQPNRVIYVNTNPHALYEIDVTTSAPGTQSIDSTDIGLNVDLLVAASTVGSLSTSGMTVDGDTAAAVDADRQWHIEGIVETAVSGSTTYATRVLVRANQPYQNNKTGV